MHRAFRVSPLIVSCLQSLERGGARGAGYVQKEWSNARRVTLRFGDGSQNGVKAGKKKRRGGGGRSG